MQEQRLLCLEVHSLYGYQTSPVRFVYAKQRDLHNPN